MKNIFLLNSSLKIETSFNKEAGILFNTKYEEFKQKVRACVEESIKTKTDNVEFEDFTIKFSEFNSVHEKILNNLK